MIQVTVNGENREMPENSTVAHLVEALELTGKRIAVEMNGEIVPKSQHPTTTIDHGVVSSVTTSVAAVPASTVDGSRTAGPGTGGVRSGAHAVTGISRSTRAARERRPAVRAADVIGSTPSDLFPFHYPARGGSCGKAPSVRQNRWSRDNSPVYEKDAREKNKKRQKGR